MSSQATDWAWSQTAGAAKLLLLALAERADRYGVAWAGRLTLAEMIGTSPKTVTDNMKRLEDAKLVARVQRRRENGSRTSDWTILAPLAVDRGKMEDHPTDTRDEDVATLARRAQGYESSPNDLAGSGEDSGGTRTNSKPTDREGGAGAPEEKVPRGASPATWRRTVRILEAFNAESGRKFGATKGDGSMSEAAKRIHQRVKEFPQIDSLEAWVDIIRRALASKWWGDDAPSVGVVFGPKVFEENMSRELREQRSQRRQERLTAGQAAHQAMQPRETQVEPHREPPAAALSDWGAIVETLRAGVSAEIVEIWLDPLHVHDVDASELTIAGDPALVGALLTNRYWTAVQRAAAANGNTIRMVSCGGAR